MIILRNNSRGDNSFTVDLSQHVNNDHCRYHDPIEVLSEKSFRVRFPVNNKFLILHLLGIDLDTFDFDFFFLPFFIFDLRCTCVYWFEFVWLVTLEI